MGSQFSNLCARIPTIAMVIAIATALVLPGAASAQSQMLVVEADARTGQYLITVSPQREGSYELTVATGTAGRIVEVPGECGPGSVLDEQILDMPEAHGSQAPPVTRTVLRCMLEQADSYAVRHLPVTVIEYLESGTSDMAATLYDLNGHELERREWVMIPSTMCAPASGAPTSNAQDKLETTAGGPARAVIAGTAPAHTVVTLVGIDNCHRYIHRDLTVTAEGAFQFVGLLPGRYALLNDAQVVLQYAIVPIDAPVVDDLDLVDPLVGPVYGRGVVPTDLLDLRNSPTEHTGEGK